MDKYYWLFSSSAQSIAAFVAFLLTGYALVLNQLENIQKYDPTYTEINESLKAKDFRRLKLVSSITGLAIAFNLICIILNGYTDWFIPIIMVLTALLTILSIVVGLSFVISIINPDRFKIAAKKLLKDYSNEDETIDQSVFIKEFINLETKIRALLKSKNLYVPNGRNIRMDFSVRQMVSTLYENNVLSGYEYDKLLKLNKYRNLVFHGHETKVYKSTIDDVKELNNLLEKKLN
jgi:hypothetical protein